MILFYKILITSILTCANLSQINASTILTKTVILGLQQSFTIPMPKTTQVNIQGGKYIRVQDFTTSLKVTGKKEGTSYIQVNNKSFQINILNTKLYTDYYLIKNKIKNFWGPKLKLINGEIQIFGHIRRLSDWLAIAKLPLQTNYSFKSKPEKYIHKKINNHFKKLCKSQFIPCPYIQFTPYPKLIAPKKTKKYLTQWKSIFKKFGLTITFTNSSFDLEPNIHIQVLITEVNKSFQKQVGIQWTNSLHAQLLPSFKTTNSLPLALKMLESSGEGQILAQPNLLAKSGTEAKFLAGGEFPVKTSGIKGSHVSWKHYGIVLKIKAYRAYNNSIENHLNLEISDLDNANTVDGIPAIKKSYINSVINTSNGKYIALSGLLKHNTGHDTDSLPWLSQLPILGPLFKSENFKNSKTELVIFLKSTLKE